MTIDSAKLIHIGHFLSLLGYHPVKQGIKDEWYISPLRDEKTASFHVYRDGRRWHDFGNGCGGDIIDLAKHMLNAMSTREALARIEEITGNEWKNMLMPRKVKNIANEYQQATIAINSVGDLSTTLLRYSRSRGIHDAVIKKFCHQVNFTAKGKDIFAIGFKNDLAGWEVRNSFYKGVIGKKAITSMVDIDDKPIAVFEGFFDYLSSFELGWMDIYDHNAIVLNSTSLVESAIPFLLSRQVILSLDNDKAGRDAAKKISAKCDIIDDWSQRYSNYNDVNEYLMR